MASRGLSTSVLAAHLHWPSQQAHIVATGAEARLQLNTHGCVYSSGRTVAGGARVFAFEQHVDRLAKIALRGGQTAVWAGSAEARQQRCLPATRLAVSTFADSNPGFFGGREAKLTWLVTPDDELYVHVAELPAFPAAAPVEVVLGTGHRADPEVKSTDWAIRRVAYEKKAEQDGVHEIVLADDAGNMYEGLQSNFYVVDRAGRLITAAADCTLTGTIQSVLLNEVAPHVAGLVVERRCPTLDDVEDCQAAFLTSSSRIILPISAIHVALEPSAQPSRILQLPSASPVVDELRAKLIRRIEADSTPL